MIFLSKVRELRIVMKPKWVTKDPIAGVQIHEGKDIQFEDGQYTTEDPEVIAYIKSRPGFGSKVTCIEQGDIPDAKGPEVVTGSMGGGGGEKRSFKCIRCGMDGFTSGFEVAQHRKDGECDMIREADNQTPDAPVTNEGAPEEKRDHEGS